MQDRFHDHEAYPEHHDHRQPHGYHDSGPSFPGQDMYEEVVLDADGDEETRYVTLVGGKEDPYQGKIYHSKKHAQHQRHVPAARGSAGRGTVEEHEYSHTTSDTYEYEVARDDKGRRAKWEEGRRYVPERRERVRADERSERRAREGYKRERRERERGRERDGDGGKAEHVHHHYHGRDGHDHGYGHPGGNG